MRVSEYAFDVDGVLANFSAGVFRLLGRPMPAEYPWDFVPRGLWERMGPRFWEGLEPIPAGFALLHQAVALKVPVCFITAPPSTRPDAAYIGKVRWFRKHLPDVDIPRDVTFTSGKTRLVHPGRVLIDDRQENVDHWRKLGGPAITFPAPYNEAKGVDPWSLKLRRTI